MHINMWYCHLRGAQEEMMRRLLIALAMMLPGVASAQNLGPTYPPLNLALAPQPSYAASAVLAKTTSANLYGFDLTQGATAGYFAFLNANVIPGAGAPISPLACVYVAAGGSVRTRADIPDRYSVGVVILDTTSCTTYTATPSVLIAPVLQ